jgi:hypothetical protein
MVFSSDFFDLDPSKSLEIQELLGNVNWELSVDELKGYRSQIQELLK